MSTYPIALATQVSVFSATVTLTDDQIKALPTTPIELVAAPGAGKALCPIAALAQLDNSAGAYTADAGSSWLLMWAGGSYIGNPRVVAGALGTPGSYMLSLPAIFLKEGEYVGGGFNLIVIGDTSFQQRADAENKAIQLKDDWNGVSDYTDGDAANSMKVTVIYYIVDVS